MKLMVIFLLGLAILVGALVLNVIASRLGLMSWFEFVKEPGKADMLSYLWLFIFYPLGLGLIAYGAALLLKLP